MHPIVDFRLHAQKLGFVNLAVCPHGDEIVQALFQLGQLRPFLLEEGCVVLGGVLVIHEKFHCKVQYCVGQFTDEI